MDRLAEPLTPLMRAMSSTLSAVNCPHRGRYSHSALALSVASGVITTVTTISSLRGYRSFPAGGSADTGGIR
jgi:hypothetical protein